MSVRREDNVELSRDLYYIFSAVQATSVKSRTWCYKRDWVVAAENGLQQW